MWFFKKRKLKKTNKEKQLDANLNFLKEALNGVYGMSIGSSINGFENLRFQNAIVDLHFEKLKLTEKEYSMMLDILNEKRIGREKFQIFVETLISVIHFSEDFLLKYALGNCKKETIMLLHEKDINSGKYSKLALALSI